MLSVLQPRRLGWWLVVALGALAVTGCSRPATQTDEWITQEVYKSYQASQAHAGTVSQVPEAPAPPTAAAPAVAPADGTVHLAVIETVRRALAGNHDIQIAGFQPPETQQDITVAEAVFDPSVFLTTSFGRMNRPTQSLLDTGVAKDTVLIQDTWSFQGGMKSKVPTGGTFAVYQSSQNLKSNSVFVVPDPQYATALNFEFAQPFLRGAGIDYNTAPIRVANLNSGITFQDFRAKVMDVVATVVNAYWQLAFDLESVRVSKVSMELAAEVLRRETARRAKGVSAEVDLNRAQAAVALRHADVLRAENAARDDMDRLKLLMNAPDLPLSGTLRILPTDAPQIYVIDINRAEAIATAIARRPEIEHARLAVNVNRIRTDVANTDRLPKLDANAKYQANALAKNFNTAVGHQSFEEYDSWTAGFEFELPLGNRAADATWRKMTLQYEQSLVELDQAVAKATQDVNLAVRAIQEARAEVDATLQGKIAAERTVRGERTRFELGQSTNDELLRAQETLANAERDYLRALLNFNLGLVSLARAQGTLLENQGVVIFQPEGTPNHPRPMGLKYGTMKPETRTMPVPPPAAPATTPSTPATPAAAPTSPVAVPREPYPVPEQGKEKLVTQ